MKFYFSPDYILRTIFTDTFAITTSLEICSVTGSVYPSSFPENLTGEEKDMKDTTQSSMISLYI